MTRWAIILRNLVYHRRVNLSVALGVAAATAVVAGALIVGESMRYSLQKVALERLAKIDELVIVDHFFREELVTEIKATEEFKANYTQAVPAIIFPRVTTQLGRGDDSIASTEVFLIGCDETFWDLDDGQLRPKRSPGSDEIIINEQLAQDLGISAAEVRDGKEFQVLIRVPQPQSVHGDSALGKKQAGLVTVDRLKVIEVVPNRGLARFGLHPTQTISGNAFVSLERLQSELKAAVEPRRPRRGEETLEAPEPIESPINAILLAGKGDAPPSPQATAELQKSFPLKLDDLGLWLNEVELSYSPGAQPAPVVAKSYFSLSSRDMMLTPTTEELAEEAFGDERSQIGLTYLANGISLVKGNNPVSPEPIPFSTITAIDFGPAFSPVSAQTGETAEPLSDDGIALTQWTADDLGAEIGDTIRIAYYDPETTHGIPFERTKDFVLEDILAFTPRDFDEQRRRVLPYTEAPTWTNDPALTPYVPGFSDAESIRDEGVLPFPTRDKMRANGADDRYWDRYRTTPKAYVSVAVGKGLWGSRFGEATMVRVPSDEGLGLAELEAQFLAAREEANEPLGFVVNPIKRQWIAASSGTTPFDVLFLSLSMFIIVSAIILIALLFRLGVEQRADQIGLLLAMGFTRGAIGRMLIWEGMIISAVGSAVGVLGGIGYAWLMVYLLTTRWRDAIVTPFLELHWSAVSLLAGFGSGIFVAAATILVTLFVARGSSVVQLLSGRLEGPRLNAQKKRSRITEILVAVLLVIAVGLAGWATQLGGEMQAGAFVGAGCLLLTALLMATWKAFRVGIAGKSAAQLKSFSLTSLAQSNVARNAGRSTLTIGLVAVASFLIVAISSFHLKPSAEGTAGFDYIIETNLPVFEDINSAQGRQKLFRDEARYLDGCTILSFRYKAGDNASCNNPYQTSQPRILGVTRETARYFDREGTQAFAWAGSTAATDRQEKNPWHLLFVDRADDDETIPVVIDRNTAMYSLKVYSVGSEFEVTYDETTTIKFRVVGFLANSVLQGSLLVSEEDLTDKFNDISGFQYFLMSLPGDANSEARAKSDEEALGLLRRQLGDEGFSAVSTEVVLRELLAVQNTYLSTFQSLGAIGLLFGTFGLATVQVRNMLERRKEMALMQAEGYSRVRLGWMVAIENSSILLRGLGIGLAAALFSVLPHMIFGDATVPWAKLATMLAVIVAVGFATSALAIRTLMSAPLLGSLRGE